VYLDGAAAPIANSITAVGELLQRRLGMSRSEFFNTYFTGQKELNVMAAMSPSERAQFLSRVLGYEKLRAAQELARERRRVVVAEAAGLRSGMPDADAVWRQLADASRASPRPARAAPRARRAARDGSAATPRRVAPRWAIGSRERERLLELLGRDPRGRGARSRTLRARPRPRRGRARGGRRRARGGSSGRRGVAPIEGLRRELSG
jgi:exonuclease SbcC